MSVFVDTSIWYAAADTSDSANTQAKALLSQGEVLLTSDHVVIETWSLFRNRLGHGKRGDSGRC
jgi:predicted nucleic acid-binding protein